MTDIQNFTCCIKKINIHDRAAAVAVSIFYWREVEDGFRFMFHNKMNLTENNVLRYHIYLLDIPFITHSEKMWCWKSFTIYTHRYSLKYLKRYLYIFFKKYYLTQKTHKKIKKKEGRKEKVRKNTKSEFLVE